MKLTKANYLFPHSYRKPGLFLFLFMIALGSLWVIKAGEGELLESLFYFEAPVFAVYVDEYSLFSSAPEGWFQIVTTEIIDEIICVGLIVGGILVAFSKERVEDEAISSIRLKSLVWATYVNYAILLFTVMFIYGLGFFWVMVYNMFTLLLIFLIKFHWSLYLWRKESADEE